MKTTYKTYKLGTNGKILTVSLLALFRAVGIEGEVTEGAIPADALDLLRVGVERNDTTGVTFLKRGGESASRYEIDGDLLTIYVANLPAGISRVLVFAQYGTNKPASLVVELTAPQNVDFLVVDGTSTPLVRTPEKDEESEGQYYAFTYKYGDVVVWLTTEKPNLIGDTTAFVADGIESTLADATEETGRIVRNIDVAVYDENTDETLAPVSTFGSNGGGTEYKTDIYMDGAGRVVLERLEDGSTMLLDEHENPIFKRDADGTTEIYDAYQSVRQGVTPHGNIWMNVPSDGQFSVNGAMANGASGNVASGANSHAEGYGCQATGAASHAEGTGTVASGQASHAEGSASTSSATVASGDNSHAEGLGSQARGKNSHAEGLSCIAIGVASHAEGSDSITQSGADYSHAEGLYGNADARYSHAEGMHCGTHATTSHAEGNYCSTGPNGGSAHAEGSYTNANGVASHTEGYHTNTTEGGSHAQGCWNKVEGGQYAFMHGCGTDADNLCNAFLIAGDQVYMRGIGGYDGTNYGTEGVKSVQTVIRELQLKLVNS